MALASFTGFVTTRADNFAALARIQHAVAGGGPHRGCRRMEDVID